jgi:opacity protein-like surface antigen
MRKFLGLLGLVLLSVTCAKAQGGPTVDLAGTYQYVRLPGSYDPNVNCQGFGGNAAINVNRWMSIVGDFGFCKVTGFPTGDSSHYVNYLFGPRVSLRSYGRVTPYVQTLLGGDRNSTQSIFGSQSSNSFALTLGGGTDIRLTPHVSFRAIQVEYLYTRFVGTGKQNNLRIETGLVYHFGGK